MLAKSQKSCVVNTSNHGMLCYIKSRGNCSHMVVANEISKHNVGQIYIETLALTDKGQNSGDFAPKPPKSSQSKGTYH
jgi:hypothetical protein